MSTNVFITVFPCYSTCLHTNCRYILANRLTDFPFGLSSLSASFVRGCWERPLGAWNQLKQPLKGRNVENSQTLWMTNMWPIGCFLVWIPNSPHSPFYHYRHSCISLYSSFTRSFKFAKNKKKPEKLNWTQKKSKLQSIFPQWSLMEMQWTEMQRGLKRSTWLLIDKN